MPSSQKPTKNTAGTSARQVKNNQKVNQRQTEKPAPRLEAEPEEAELAPTTARESKSGATATTARERKPAAPANTGRERKSSAPPTGARERKLTPQQQVHLARARRRQLNQRLGLGTLALLVIIAIAIVIQQVVAKNEADARQATANATQTALHLHATATAGAKATATENAVAPDAPPTVTGKTVTLPGGLQYIDIKVGTGPAAKSGDSISVQYTGWLQDGGTKFDSSYDDTPGQPFTLTLGAGQVIPGWDQGIVGMQAGGERRLIIPPALAYGATGSTQGKVPIPPNATLIFDILMVSITPAGG